MNWNGNTDDSDQPVLEGVTCPESNDFNIIADINLSGSSVQLFPVEGYDDWSNLDFDFTSGFTFANGIADPVQDEPDPLIAETVLHELAEIAVHDGANDPPKITSDGGGSSAAVSVPENQTGVTDVQSIDDSDSEGSGLLYTISGGADQGKFSINSATGNFSFNTAPDFENPSDAGDNNVYNVQVTVTDSGSLTDVQDIAVTVADLNEASEITSDGGGASAAVTVPENQTAVTNVQSTDDGDFEGSGLLYSISGGAAQGKFSISAAAGELSFNTAPDFDNPSDAGNNNVYNFQVTVTDSGGLTDVQDIAVTVTGVIEPLGRMTGSVRLDVAGRITHGFQIHCDASDLPNNLQVNFVKDNKFYLEELTLALCSNAPNIDEGKPVADFDTFVGSGTGRYNGVSGATITFTFTDAGEPGRNDTTAIKIVDAVGSAVVDVSAKLRAGNHQAHSD